MSTLTDSPLWLDLRAHARRLQSMSTAELFRADPARAQQFAAEACGLYLDYSKQRLDGPARASLLALAEQQRVAEWRGRMYAGEAINATEQRAAWHVALRAPGNEILGTPVPPEVAQVRAAMATFADDVRSGRHVGASGARISDVVNIGIGGSDFGPRMVCAALAPRIDGPRPHFVANVDPAELAAVLAPLDPARTLVVVASKTFTTQETLANARAARQWLVEALGEAAVAAHFVAVSTNAAAVAAFGIPRERTFGFWDWVGGRYSLWSAVGLSALLALGPEQFDALAAGAHAMDRHFAEAPPLQNLPLLSGLLGVWNHNFIGCASQVVVPYAERLGLFCGWLQQLEMESNGKGVDRDGRAVDYPTTPALWGSVGSNAQHAYFQMLHQGPALHAVDFILPLAADGGPLQMQMQRMLIANCLAQSAALMRGKPAEEVAAELESRGLRGPALTQALPHRVFPGSRPSSTLLLPRLDPWHLGALLALYEHRTFVQSVLWNINAFDQWGVELGKRMAGHILDPGQQDGLDPSTRLLIQRSGLAQDA